MRGRIQAMAAGVVLATVSAGSFYYSYELIKEEDRHIKEDDQARRQTEIMEHGRTICEAPGCRRIATTAWSTPGGPRYYCDKHGTWDKSRGGGPVLLFCLGSLSALAAYGSFRSYLRLEPD